MNIAPNISLDYPNSNNLIGDGPEGPEVRSVAEYLHSILENKVLDRIEWDQQSRYSRENIPGYADIILPAKIEGVTVKGKQIVFMFQNFYMISFLGMEGKWLIDPGNHSNLIFHFQDFDLYYDDSRHFGQIKFYATPEALAAKLNTIGPDILTYSLYLHGRYQTLPESEHITPDRWRSKFKNKRITSKEVGVFLLDQKRFAGIGTYLCAEILYRAKVSPHRPLGELTDEEIEATRQAALDIIYSSYQSKGHTFNTYRAPNGEIGEFHCVIYNEDICPQGYPIIKTKLKDNRYRYWVPDVQT